MTKESLHNATKTSVSDNLTVYVLHRDVEYEFGHVVAVFSTYEKAEEGRQKALKERYPGTRRRIYQRSELSIEEWALDDYLQA